MSETKKSNGTNIRRGLDADEVVRSREMHGSNVLRPRKSKSFARRFFENLGDPVIRILLVALVVDLVFVFKGGDIFETVGIAISVFLASFISALSEHGGENAFRRLSCECDVGEYRVRRGGRTERVSINDIVVGDVVLLSAGEKVPADGNIVSGRMRVDQSAITGESKEIEKSPANAGDRSPSSRGVLLRGCPVVSGEGEMVVFAVGDDSFLGKISIEVQSDTRESPLKLRLTKLAKQISRLGYLAAALVAITFLFNCFVIDSGFSAELILIKLKNVPYLLENLLHAFMLGLTVIVVAVPEGLPMMIAVVLSSNIRRMVKDNVLVRKPVGIEAAGSMNILFTDKTGTLTEGRMSVCGMLLPDGYLATDVHSLMRRDRISGEVYVDSCRLNNGAQEVGNEVVGGNSTDRALLKSVLPFCHGERACVLRRLPFDSAIKYSSVTVRLKGKELSFVKGAPEKLLPHVVSYLSGGAELPFDMELRRQFERKIGELCEDGKRVLLVCTSNEIATARAVPELCVVCAVALGDPLRLTARRSVKELKDAGIGVVMITGDGKATATAIALGCGIIGGERTVVLDGAELERMSDGKICEVLPRLAVVSRALPTDKSRLVRIAQSRELVVGMTGDGVNDAPALKLADVGFAMGSGTDVSKDAGDIIVLDNNLASIVKAVLYGRNIFKSIRKFITLQLTMNLCAVGISMIGPFIGIDAPVTVVQMLWINIIMDTLGGLAFAGEAPSPLCMKEPPKRRDEPILNRYMVDQIVLLGGSTVALFLFFLRSPAVSEHFRYAHDGIYLLTAFFALFIFTSVFNCFNCRCDRLKMLSGISKNPVFIIIMLMIAAVQIAFIYLGGSVLRTVPLTASELGFTMLMSLSVFPIELVRRLLWRLRGKKNGF